MTKQTDMSYMEKFDAATQKVAEKVAEKSEKVIRKLLEGPLGPVVEALLEKLDDMSTRAENKQWYKNGQIDAKEIKELVKKGDLKNAKILLDSMREFEPLMAWYKDLKRRGESTEGFDEYVKKYVDLVDELTAFVEQKEAESIKQKGQINNRGRD